MNPDDWVKYHFQRSVRDMNNALDQKWTIDSNPFSEWLYGEWSKDKLTQYEFLRAVPVVGDYMDFLLDRRADEEYLKRYGMGYSDIHDPRKLRQSGSGSRFIGSSLQFVSRNVTRLYR